MWNYNFVIPSFMILVILLVYYLSRPQLKIHINDTFLWLLAIESLVIMLDIVASGADENFASFPVSVLYVLNMLFFVFFLARIFWFFLFLTDVLHMNLEAKPKKLIAYGFVFFLCELITIVSPILNTVFYIGPDGYHSGPLYNILYVCFLFYIFLSFALLARHRTKLRPFDLYSCITYNVILLAGTITRFLLPRYLVMNTFCLMALIIIYLSFQNPDFYGSDRGPSFNQKAFHVKLDEIRETRRFRILCFVLRNYSDEREIYGFKQMDHGITLISQYLAETYKEEEIFYLRNGCFALIGDETMDWDTMRNEIQKRFQKPWRAAEADLFLNISFVRISDRSKRDDTDTIINRLLTAFNECGKKIGLAGALIDLDEIHDIDRQVDIKRALERAIEQNKVEIYLQPLIECKTGIMKGAEVLARITNEEGRVISPAVFIPIAEQNGQINRLGAQVFEKACQFIHDKNLEKTGLEWLNVNLSPIQCMRKDLSAEFDGILRKYDVNAGQIHLEITEASMIDLSLLQKQIQTLRENGFQFALDDYGTGYSNLTRVKHYPFINIKLDMEVVWDYYRDRDVLLPAIISAFKQLNFSVTAEGIETKEMGEALTAIGCDYLQGYYFSKPLPEQDFVSRYRILH